MFTNEHSISDDDILSTDSTLFRGARVSERPIPSFPRIREESNEHPTIDTQTDSPKDANDDVSTTPRIDPTSFHSKLFEITTDDSLPDSSNADPEITIAHVHGDTSILLEDIVSMLLETIVSLGALASFFWCLLSAELSISEKCIDFNDSVDSIHLCAISMLSPMYIPSCNEIDKVSPVLELKKSELEFRTEERRCGNMDEFEQIIMPASSSNKYDGNEERACGDCGGWLSIVADSEYDVVEQGVVEQPAKIESEENDDGRDRQK
ncbi:hypothetical protein BLNAU_9264 [Blattamonas nauphoetae]|uniref:Uncharacterized protein n=1 Tax=Blattamonas nauphoetae TaxID=2049346 RepID=A0ABQ9XW68_9EUKA|nr:hypothetical protein BLNAU_9264 [Blattamonas nauphoetae]